jgi:hypothetical protein
MSGVPGARDSGRPADTDDETGPSETDRERRPGVVQRTRMPRMEVWGPLSTGFWSDRCVVGAERHRSRLAFQKSVSFR